MAPLRWRRLTDGERDLAQEVFGGALDAARIRILSLPAWPRPFVPNGRFVVWPAASALADFAAAPVWLRSVLVHELVHAWQAQNGVFLPLAKLKAGDGRGAYAYDLGDGRPFAALNIEQQAMVVQHAYLAREGGSAPYAAPRYADYMGDWTNAVRRKPRRI
jgi:hypothetical protein